MVRVKLTGEVTEVAREVMKILRAEEKKLRRSFTGEASEEGEDGNETVLSLDALPDDDVKSAAWLQDTTDLEAEVMTEIMEKQFVSSLSDYQRKVYSGTERGLGRLLLKCGPYSPPPNKFNEK